MSLREDAAYIIKQSIGSVLPGNGVKNALKDLEMPEGRLLVIAVGKAGYTMAKAAEEALGDRIDAGLVITKYDHVKGNLPHFTCREAGHPVPDANSYGATEEAIHLAEGLTENDLVLFLLSGGASALFEKPAIKEEEMQAITTQLLQSGADITEINTVRKHLSTVKGGRFAAIANPAKVHSVILSDVLGNDLSAIGSGPTCPDKSTGEEAFAIIDKYHIRMSADALETLMKETPKTLTNVTFQMIGDVSILCESAKAACLERGYQPVLLTDELNCEARDAGAFMASIGRTYQGTRDSIAFIAGGETVVHVHGDGKGGRNQEMALAASIGISGLKDTCFFSVGSDGTDGPTDAAGGIVDQDTAQNMKNAGINIYKMLENNDAYNALHESKSLIITGATGTNVNDLSVLLIKR